MPLQAALGLGLPPLPDRLPGEDQHLSCTIIVAIVTTIINIIINVSPSSSGTDNHAGQGDAGPNPDRGQHPPSQPLPLRRLPGCFQALHPAWLQPNCHMGGRLWGGLRN